MAAVYLPLLFSSLALLISFFSFLFFRSYLKRRTGQERILAEFRQEVNSILKSIDETTDRDISLIEEREKNLKSVLSETERRMKVFIRELEGRRAEVKIPDISAEGEIIRIPKNRPSYEELGKNRYKTQDLPAAKTTAPALPVIEPAPAGQQNMTGQPSMAAQPSMADKIRSLTRQGLSEAAIASQLGISISEVELAVTLLRQKI